MRLAQARLSPRGALALAPPPGFRGAAGPRTSQGSSCGGVGPNKSRARPLGPCAAFFFFPAKSSLQLPKKELLIRGMPVPKEEADQKRRQQRPMPCCCSPPSPLQKGPCSSAVRRRSPTPLLASAELTIKSPAKRQPPSSSKSHWTADCTKSRSDSSQRGSLLADCLFASFVAALFVCCSL